MGKVTEVLRFVLVLGNALNPAPCVRIKGFNVKPVMGTSGQFQYGGNEAQCNGVFKVAAAL